MRRFQILVIVVLALAVAPQAFAQGCSMCYSGAAQQDAQQQQALNLGIIVLIIPPVLLFAGVLATAFRRRDEASEPSDHPGKSQTYPAARPDRISEEVARR